MVSFFGLKLGSDRKKAQTNAQTNKAPRKWDRIDQNAVSGSQDFAHDFSRPHFPSSTSRPGTANSTRSISNWRAVFKNPAMTSSMVDLAPPRRRQPSVGSLRHAASDMNFRSGPGLPAALGGSGLRPGTLSRPATSQKAGSEWVNPLDVHFCTASATSRPGKSSHEPNAAVLAAAQAPKAPAPPRNFIGNLNLGPSAGGGEEGQTNHASYDHVRKSDENHVIRNGYPSPPQSDNNSDRAFSPVNSDNGVSVNKRNLTSSLRRMDVPGPTSLPSPPPSAQRTRQDPQEEGPTIRNGPARRDTLAFHQPRRPSFAMGFEGIQRATIMHPPKEGFSGNFADFDFGEFVTKTMMSNASVQDDKASFEEVCRSSVSSCSTKDSLRFSTLLESPSSPFMYATRPNEREHSKSPAPTHASEDQVTNSSLIDQLPQPPREATRRPSGPPSTAIAVHQEVSLGSRIGPRQGFQSRFDSDSSSRAPPPQPLRPATSSSAANHALELSSRDPFGPPLDSSTSCVREGQLSPRSQDKPPSSPFTRRPMEGDFPVSKGLPRGRRPEPLQAHPVSAPDHEGAEFLLPAWSGLDRSEPRLSAIPAPLTPARPYTSHGSGTDVSTPTSAVAPRIPSPTFPSLEQSISGLSSTFGKRFEINFDEHLNSPTLGEFPSIGRCAGGVSRCVEAKKAPARPAPATLPRPSNGQGGIVPTMTPAATEFSATFI
ncbi:hypothetical protein EsDP_00004444 [Epichloe bromicola]|uniref:Uncharacterized protein n=2 Tax=Epichloe bromicola TaxID=79588 RepID=A0ABQ0CRQ9_9HYPO